MVKLNIVLSTSFSTGSAIRTVFKYILIDDELYHQTVNDVLLKCLDPDDAILVKVA
jgi:hypothetical protein